jgi:hypothetical protein
MSRPKSQDPATAIKLTFPRSELRDLIRIARSVKMTTSGFVLELFRQHQKIRKGLRQP